MSETGINFTYLFIPFIPAFSQQTVGVIYKTERDSFRVLDQNGQTRLVHPHQITMRKDSRRAIATDSQGYEIRIGDNMKEVDGEVYSFSAPSVKPVTETQGTCRAVKEALSIFIKPSTHSSTTARSLKMVVCSSLVREVLHRLHQKGAQVVRI